MKLQEWSESWKEQPKQVVQLRETLRPVLRYVDLFWEAISSIDSMVSTDRVQPYIYMHGHHSTT